MHFTHYEVYMISNSFLLPNWVDIEIELYKLQSLINKLVYKITT